VVSLGHSNYNSGVPMKKQHGYYFLGAAALLWYADANTPAGATCATVPSWQLQLNTIDNYPSSLFSGAPNLHLLLAGIGIYLLMKGGD
jgi:hypothetical protein